MCKLIGPSLFRFQVMVIVNYTWLGIRVEALQSWNAFVNRNDVKGFDFWFSDDIVVGLMKLAS